MLVLLKMIYSMEKENMLVKTSILKELLKLVNELEKELRLSVTKYANLLTKMTYQLENLLLSIKKEKNVFLSSKSDSKF